MSRIRLCAAILPLLTMAAVTAYAGGIQEINFGPTLLGGISTACFFNGAGTFDSINVSPPYFVRGIRLGPISAGADVCDPNISGLTAPTTLPRTTGPGEQLVFDVDLVATELGTANSTLSINGSPEYNLMSVGTPLLGCSPCGGCACLSDDRFQVQIHWRTNFGTRGPAPVVPVGSDDSGLFYFFNPDNWEVLIKVLNACNSSAPRFWVFAAATTNVEYTITVTDTEEQVAKSYFKPQGPPAPAITDTNAFATCP